MEALLAARGFACAAYALDYGQLEGAAARYAPLVAHYDKPLGHFVLVLTARDGMLVVADPASGLQRLERRDFEARWDGYVLLAARPGAAPRRGVLDAAVASALAPARLLDFEARRELRVRP
jgi:ABC-type bacteriocin/lantibiotic exporter with double-glycine peptidase domain